METNKSENTEENSEKRIGRLPENTISYFKRVDQMLDEDVFEDEEHKETFLRNVYTQIEESTTQLLRHTLTSKVLEKIIPLLSDELYTKFITFVEEDIQRLSTDRFASHVIETLCKSIQTHMNEKIVVKKFCKLSKRICKEVSILLRDTYGSHVIGTLLQVFSGTKVSEKVTKSRYGNKENKSYKDNSTALIEVTTASSDLPQLFDKYLIKFVDAILDDDNFGELLSHRHASSCLQVLLLVTSKQEREVCNKAVDHILEKVKIYKITESIKDDDEDAIHRLPPIMVDEIGSHLFEVVLRTAVAKTQESLMCKCFQHIIGTMSLHPIANFTSQLIMRLVTDTEIADSMIEKLLSYMEDILACGHMGCVVAISEMLIQFQLENRQKEFFKVIKTALHIPDTCQTKPLAKLVLCLLTYDVFFDDNTAANNTSSKDSVTSKTIDKSQVNYHGVQILKNCFAFHKNKLIIDSFLSISPAELLLLANHLYGGFVYESFYASQTITSRKKDKLSETLFEHIETISCDKFGSRVVDAIWKNSSEDMRTKLQGILTENKLKLSNNMYGRIILSNCNVYKNRRFEQKEVIEKRKRKFVADVMQADVPKEIVTSKSQPKQEEPKKKKKEKDRAEKYREQLKSLGISIETT